jgi:putative hydrolase of the HAD superfamily
MIKAIFFDMYGTLAGFNPSRFEIQSKAAADFGITLTEEGVLRGYAAADVLMAEQNLSEPLRTLDDAGKAKFFAEYERKVLLGSGVEVDSETAGAVWRRVRQVPYEMTTYSDVEPTLVALRGNGLALGVISNMNRTGEALGKDLGLTGLVDFVVTSLEVGAEKPYPPIFNAALARASVEADEAVHVGDQLSSDIEGARSVGIHPVLIDRDGNHEGYCDAPRITGLDQLSDVFEAL